MLIKGNPFMNTSTIHHIGIVRNDIKTIDDAPKNYSISEEIGALEIYPEFQEGLYKVKAGQIIVVLFWLHNAKRDVFKVYPRGDKSRGLHGVFTTRSPARPNPIAISELELLNIEENILTVKGLDVLNGTPIIDIKKKI